MLVCCYSDAHDGSNSFWFTLARHVLVFKYNTCLTLLRLQQSYDIVATAVGLSANHVEGMSQSQLRNTSLNTHMLLICYLHATRVKLIHSISLYFLSVDQSSLQSAKRSVNHCINFSVNNSINRSGNN